MAKFKTNPDDAYEFYRSLGASRSLKKVAEHFKCAERTVKEMSRTLGWEKKLAKEGLESPYGRLASEYAADMLEELLKTIKEGGITVRSATDAVKLGEFFIKLIDKGVAPAEEQSIQKTIKGYAKHFGVAG